MSTTSLAHNQSLRRKIRVRASLSDNISVPRLSVHRTLRHIYAQIIDDQKGITLCAFSDKNLTDVKGTKSEVATKVGEGIAKLAKTKKVTAVRFDRGSYRYHGRVAALADGARSNGLNF